MIDGCHNLTIATMVGGPCWDVYDTAHLWFIVFYGSHYMDLIGNKNWYEGVWLIRKSMVYTNKL